MLALRSIFETSFDRHLGLLLNMRDIALWLIFLIGVICFAIRDTLENDVVYLLVALLLMTFLNKVFG